MTKEQVNCGPIVDWRKRTEPRQMKRTSLVLISGFRPLHLHISQSWFHFIRGEKFISGCANLQTFAARPSNTPSPLWITRHQFSWTRFFYSFILAYKSTCLITPFPIHLTLFTLPSVLLLSPTLLSAFHWLFISISSFVRPSNFFCRKISDCCHDDSCTIFKINAAYLFIIR